MKRLPMLMILLAILNMTGIVKAQTNCSDLNTYPMSKNTGGVSAFRLTVGSEELAAQTYHYSGTGSIAQVRVYGSLPTGNRIPLNVNIYNVDASGRPTSLLKSVAFTWWRVYNTPGFFDVSVGNVKVTSDFAVGLELATATSGRSFDISYNGDLEGRKEDLGSLAGTSTGFNWASSKNSFSKDGDFYLLPLMTNPIAASFKPATPCLPLNSAVTFTNTSSVTTDSMFNRIMLAHYTGSKSLYTWDFGDNSTISYVVSPSHTYTKAGQYTVSLTATIDGWNNSCSNVFKMIVSVGLNVTASNITNVTCNGLANGSVTAVPVGGISPFTYSINGYNYQSSTSFKNLAAGKYYLFIKDTSGCFNNTVVTITQPGAITLSSLVYTSPTCGQTNGSFQASASGGTGTLKYSIDGSTFQASGTFTSLHSGAYAITVKDDQGCTATFPLSLNDIAGPVLSLSSYSDVSCNGGNDGSIKVSAKGGKGAYSYSIDGKNYVTSANFLNLKAGTYIITMKDSSGCMDGIKVTIAQPDVIWSELTSVSVGCNGGKDGKIIVSNITGGTGSYVFSIDSKNYQQSGIFNGLAAGLYTVYVKDANNCVTTSGIAVTQPSALSVNLSGKDATCYQSDNGQIGISVSGGTAPYIYSLDGNKWQQVNEFDNMAAGSYLVYVKDANGCIATGTITIAQPSVIAASITTTNATCGNTNGKILAVASGGSGSGYKYSIDGGATYNTTGSFSNLKDSTYTLIIVDGTSCINIFAATVSSSDGAKITSISHTNVSCHSGDDGTITINTTTGGTGTLQYSIGGIYWQSAGAFTGLSAGTYTVIVKDALGCSGNSVVTLTQPAAIVITTSITNATCYNAANGIIKVYAAGGNGTLAYSVDGHTYQSSNIFTGLTAGFYNVAVRDAGNCIAYSAVSVNQPASIIISNIATLDVSCYNSKNGVIYASAFGGTGTLKFSLDDANYQTSGTFSGLKGGYYTLYVQDDNGCKISKTIGINEPTPININLTSSNVTCYGGNDGAISVAANGGVPPYTYQWSTVIQGQSVVNLKSGVYHLYVRDAIGCTKSTDITISQPDSAITVSGIVQNATSFAKKDGALKLTVRGGVPPFNYLWSTGEITRNISGLAPGQYTVTITDAVQCQLTVVFEVSTGSGIATVAEQKIDVKLYPNPANSFITIDAGENRFERISIMDILGNIISEKAVDNSQVHIDLSTFKSGLYIVQYEVNGQVSRQMFEVNK